MSNQKIVPGTGGDHYVPYAERVGNESVVYFTRDLSAAGIEKAYGMVIDQLRENPEYINDLYANLSDKIESDGTGKRISLIADKIMRYEGQGFISFTGTTKENDTIGEGIIHEEFYQDPTSVLSGLRKVINMKEYTEDESEDDED